jgi:hypothetical protein
MSDVQLATLEQLNEDRIVTVLVHNEATDEQDWFTLAKLSYVEYNETIEAVGLPPAVKRTLKGADGTNLPNYDDVEYRAELTAYDRECRLYLLGKAIKKGGKLPLPGKKLEHWAAELAKWDAGVINALWVWFKKAHQEGQVLPKDRADNFLRVRANEAVYAQAVRVVAARLEQAVRQGQDGPIGVHDVAPEAIEQADTQSDE